MIIKIIMLILVFPISIGSVVIFYKRKDKLEQCKVSSILENERKVIK